MDAVKVNELEGMIRKIVEEVVDEKLKEVWDYLNSVEQNSLPIEAGQELREEITVAVHKALN